MRSCDEAQSVVREFVQGRSLVVYLLRRINAPSIPSNKSCPPLCITDLASPLRLFLKREYKDAVRRRSNPRKTRVGVEECFPKPG